MLRPFCRNPSDLKEHRVKQSLGLLEVSGLALAITCADAMAKAAAITLLARKDQRFRLDGGEDRR